MRNVPLITVKGVRHTLEYTNLVIENSKAEEKTDEAEEKIDDAAEDAEEAVTEKA